VKHELSGGEYAQRRRQCEEAVKFFAKSNPKIRALRDVTMEDLNAAKGKLDSVVYRRAKHVVTENERTVDAATALSEQRYEAAGQLMVQSHESMRDDYEISCAELDFLADAATNIKGVYGARMTGGGFGGCIVALCQPRNVEAFSSEINQAYQRKFSITPTIFATKATDGANVVE
ncbi:MAG TPA: hypothetical protein VG722_02450, partial [Tepidisphaeraceae bacterium]|nr:hypothetical protein [Tepidisphaeraceae bacterium]